MINCYIADKSCDITAGIRRNVSKTFDKLATYPEFLENGGNVFTGRTFSGRFLSRAFGKIVNQYIVFH